MKEAQNKIYQIKEGDTLEGIAKKFDINPTSILLANKISPKNIRAGFVIFLP